jgi:hypothetical protein
MKKFMPLVLILFLASCTNAPKTGQGAAIGGAGGAAVGAAISRATGGSGWTGAAIGAVVGTVAGAVIGNTQDQKDNPTPNKAAVSAVSFVPGTYDSCRDNDPVKCRKTKKTEMTFGSFIFKPNGTGELCGGNKMDHCNEYKWKEANGEITITYTGKGENAFLPKGTQDTLFVHSSDMIKQPEKKGFTYFLKTN